MAQLAAAQNGIVGARQLSEYGMDGDAIAVRVRRGQLHRIHRGVYAVGTGVLTLRGGLTAASLACGDGAVLSHRAAGAWHGLLAWHLVRQALAEGKVNMRQLAAVLDRSSRHRGAGKLRALLADGYVPTRSELEDRALDLLAAAGIERPEVNPRLVLDGRTISPDLLWRTPRVVVELDGAAWHEDPLTRANDADKQALLEAAGLRVLRITWRQLVDHPRQTIARLRPALGLEA